MCRVLRDSCPPVSEEDFLYRTAWPPKSKAAFRNPDGTATSRDFKLRQQDAGELSVDIASKTTPLDSVTKRGKHEIGKFILYQIKVSDVNDIELSAHHDPIPGNDAHGFIWGLEDEDDIKPGLLARKSSHVPVSDENATQ